MKRLQVTAIAVAFVMSSGLALAQSSGSDGQTNRGAQPATPGAAPTKGNPPPGTTGRPGPAANPAQKPTDAQTSRGAQPVKPGAEKNMNQGGNVGAQPADPTRRPTDAPTSGGATPVTPRQ